MHVISETRRGHGSREAEFQEKIERFARVPHYVLIVGERGTGKTTIARTLHEKSSRSKGDFVNVNCASFTAELLESELFGYEKGAFTGAAAPKAGLFETAAGGTLFLDEIGELTLSLQAKLLKAVEEKRIRRVGGTSERQIDVRVIAATSRNLKAMVLEGFFRPDLFDRLNILQLETIPLRFQTEKIRELFLRQLEEERSSIGRQIPFEIDESAYSELECQEWEGNYRELLNFATRLAVESIDISMITADTVRRILREFALSATAATIPETLCAENPSRNLVTVMLDPDADNLDSIYVKAAGTFIEHVLRRTNGNLRRAARSMGTTHSTLSRILKKYNERQESQALQTQPPAMNTFAIAA
jgi:transcriptional regulator with PAS, ATPase and Fis domain